MLSTNWNRTSPFNQTQSQPIQQPPKRAQLTNSRQTKNPFHQILLQVLTSQSKTLNLSKRVDFSRKVSTSLFLNRFTLVVTLNQRQLDSQSQIRWRQTSSSANSISCQSVSDLTRFSILFSLSSSSQYNRRKLLMLNDGDVTQCSV